MCGRPITSSGRGCDGGTRIDSPCAFQPPNAELEVLTTAGVVGLLGFLALMVGTLITLSKLDPSYGTLAVAIVLNRFVAGPVRHLLGLGGRVSALPRRRGLPRCPGIPRSGRNLPSGLRQEPARQQVSPA